MGFEDIGAGPPTVETKEAHFVVRVKRIVLVDGGKVELWRIDQGQWQRVQALYIFTCSELPGVTFDSLSYRLSACLFKHS